MGDYASRERENHRWEEAQRKKQAMPGEPMPAPMIASYERPTSVEPAVTQREVVTTQKVSEVVFGLDRILDIVRATRTLIPPNAEVKGHYQRGSKLEGLVFTWREPIRD